jgi:hypothetical protein
MQERGKRKLNQILEGKCRNASQKSGEQTGKNDQSSKGDVKKYGHFLFEIREN